MSKFLIKQAFAEAMDLHRQNRLEEAKAVYNKILTVNESEPNAHHLISLIFIFEPAQQADIISRSFEF